MIETFEYKIFKKRQWKSSLDFYFARSLFLWPRLWKIKKNLELVTSFSLICTTYLDKFFFCSEPLNLETGKDRKKTTKHWISQKWQEIFLCYLFLLFRTFYVSIFHYKIDSLEEYSLATGKAMSFNFFKPQYITQENLVFNFLYCQEPRKIQYN